MVCGLWSMVCGLWSDLWSVIGRALEEQPTPEERSRADFPGCLTTTSSGAGVSPEPACDVHQLLEQALIERADLATTSPPARPPPESPRRAVLGPEKGRGNTLWECRPVGAEATLMRHKPFNATSLKLQAIFQSIKL